MSAGHVLFSKKAETNKKAGWLVGCQKNNTINLYNYFKQQQQQPVKDP